MALATDTFGMLKENLIDAGCDEETANQCMKLAKEDQWMKCIPLLKDYRKNLLDSIHVEQKRLDCLDYLTYQIQNKHGKEE